MNIDNQICRLCLKKNDTSMLVLRDNGDDYVPQEMTALNNELLHRISTITSLKIPSMLALSSVPQFLCAECDLCLTKFMTFRNKCIQSSSFYRRKCFTTGPNVCRLCLEETSKLLKKGKAKSLTLNGNHVLLDRIYSMTSIKVMEPSTDSGTYFLCAACERVLQQFTVFRSQCILNDSIFRSKMGIASEPTGSAGPSASASSQGTVTAKKKGSTVAVGENTTTLECIIRNSIGRVLHSADGGDNGLAIEDESVCVDSNAHGQHENSAVA